MLTWALRTFHHPLLHRAGTLGVFVTSFLAGWLLGGHLWIGILFASSWLFLPWLEILTRVRKLRLPERMALTPCAPPSAQDLPVLRDLTQDVEEMEFEHVEDASWEQEGLRHFFRIFYHPKRRLRATIALIEQGDLGFYYLAVSSRENLTDHESITWNYPFAYSMKIPPHWHIQRVNGEVSIEELMTRHQQFLEARGVKAEDLTSESPEEMLHEIVRRTEEQVIHNVRCGIFLRAGDGEVRYSLRGMFFLWGQFLRDLVRLS